MAKIEDFLTKNQIGKIYDHTQKYILDLPSVKPNSWDAFFIILFLILVADNKIKPAEMGFFNRFWNATFNKKWNSAHLLKGEIPKHQNLLKTASKVHEIYKVIRGLGEESIKEVVLSLSKNISNKKLQRVTLLCVVRLAISDLEIATYERKIIVLLAEYWKLDHVLNELKFNEILDKDDDFFIVSNKSIDDLIDDRGLGHKQYEEIVFLIHKNGLIIPGDELISEEFEKYRSDSENELFLLTNEHQKDIKQREQKFKEHLKLAKLKIKNDRKKFGTLFICTTFLKQINFHKNSFDMLDDRFESSIIWGILIDLNEDNHISDQIIKPKKIEGKTGWLEISKIPTGRDSLGRIYYHHSKQKGKKYNVYVDFKGDEKQQKKTFKSIDLWKRNGF
jgi:hypothetical protein